MTKSWANEVKWIPKQRVGERKKFQPETVKRHGPKKNQMKAPKK